MHDLVIRGATVVDGLGRDPVRADVAVKDGRIAAIGNLGKDAAEVVDAGGLTLMPGIIDLHTHYTRRSPGTRPYRRRPRSGLRPPSWAIAGSGSSRARRRCVT